jgi:hypothetical protein
MTSNPPKVHNKVSAGKERCDSSTVRSQGVLHHLSNSSKGQYFSIYQWFCIVAVVPEKAEDTATTETKRVSIEVMMMKKMISW